MMDRARISSILVIVAIFCYSNVQCLRKDSGKEIFGFYKIENMTVGNCPNHTSEKVIYLADIIQDNDGELSLNINFTVLEKVEGLTGKFKIFKRLNKDKLKQLMNVNIPNFCEYLVKDIPILNKQASSGCGLPTGVYDNIEVEIIKNARKLLGRKFFYGKYGAQVQIFSEKQVVICIEAYADLINARSAKKKET